MKIANVQLSPVEAEDMLRTESPRYSVCTLVSSHAKYEEMISSFCTHGFTADVCEYIYIDNSSCNKMDAYAGINFFLLHAKGEYIIICHQDIVLLADDIATLDARIEELNVLDPKWAICGNAGATRSGELVIRITDPHGTDTRRGSMPAQVVGLDENFVIMKRSANLSVTPLLRGFHLYATELCLVADFLGLTAYVIDFHLNHLSAGKIDETFKSVLHDMQRLRSSRLRPMIVINTNVAFFISGWPWLNAVGTHLLHSRLRHIMFWLLRRRAGPLT